MELLFNKSILTKDLDLCQRLYSSIFLDSLLEEEVVDSINIFNEESIALLNILESTTTKIIQYSSSMIGISYSRIVTNSDVLIKGRRVALEFNGKSHPFFLNKTNFSSAYMSLFWMKGQFAELKVTPFVSTAFQTEVIVSSAVSEVNFIQRNKKNECINLKTSFSGQAGMSEKIVPPFRLIKKDFFLVSDLIPLSGVIAETPFFTFSEDRIVAKQFSTGRNVTDILNLKIDNFPAKRDIQMKYVGKSDLLLTDKASLLHMKETNLKNYIDAYSTVDADYMAKKGFSVENPIKTEPKVAARLKAISSSLLSGDAINGEETDYSFVSNIELSLLLSELKDSINNLKVC